MKFYIASSLVNYEQVRDLSRLLRNAGWEHTFDWTLYCPVKENDAETLMSVGKRNMKGSKKKFPEYSQG